MREVDEHAEPVALRDRFAAEFGEAAVTGLGAAVGEQVGLVVGELEHPQPEIPEIGEPADVVLDRLAVLQTEHDPDTGVLADLGQILGGADRIEVV